MARAPELSPQARAFLDMIAWCEGTSTSPITQDDGYDIIVTGVNGMERFTDYRHHPFEHGRAAKQINHRGLLSSASGRYQDIIRTWRWIRAMSGVQDFSPESQDRANWWLIGFRKAQPLVEAGKIPEAIALCSVEWASLPGANVKDQKQRKMAECLACFELKGGRRG
ncbi:MAG TPA: glycoside hydrolase family 104 protein [Abditibacteriaceae bacterium]|jgi:muramidase (phage lysozyme)